jgi:hypothetical protein
MTSGMEFNLDKDHPACRKPLSPASPAPQEDELVGNRRMTQLPVFMREFLRLRWQGRAECA